MSAIAMILFIISCTVETNKKHSKFGEGQTVVHLPTQLVGRVFGTPRYDRISGKWTYTIKINNDTIVYLRNVYQTDIKSKY